ncbi:MAG: flagellar hook-length control protein FliK, partial [Campylobacterales bacterium]|nr:flagellar hook-length control protein FliK [Campylobacterales bacterium]
DKLSLQIDNYQLQSYLSNSASLYLPFDWDDMENGKIEIKHSEDDTFFCNIDLKLKEYGEVNLKLALYDTNQLNIHIYSQNDEFKKIVRENLGELKSALIDAKITPRQIKIFEPKIKQTSPYASPYENINDDIKMGFEIKI